LTPSSTFKTLVTTIYEDQIIVDSNLQKGSILKKMMKTVYEPAQDSHVESLQDDQQPIDGGNEEASSPFEGQKGQMPHGSNFEDSSEHTEINGTVRKEVVAESENESEHDFPITNVLAFMIKSISATMSKDEFWAMKKQNPIGAIKFVMNLDIFSSKTNTKSSVGIVSAHPKSYKASLLLEFQTQVLEVDLFKKIEQDENIIPKVKDLLHRLINCCRIGVYFGSNCH